MKILVDLTCCEKGIAMECMPFAYYLFGENITPRMLI